MNKTYRVTSNRMVALASGTYLGEVPVVPDTLNHLIKRGLGLPLTMPFMAYYYGKPDQEVAAKFGHEWPPKSNNQTKKEARDEKRARRERHRDREAQVRATKIIARQVARGVETGEEVKIGD